MNVNIIIIYVFIKTEEYIIKKIKKKNIKELM